MAQCENCKTKIPTMVTRLHNLNCALANGRQYFDTLGAGLLFVYDTLRRFGFQEPDVEYSITQPDGRLHLEIGEGKWVTASWHRMESGRFEVVAYVN